MVAPRAKRRPSTQMARWGSRQLGPNTGQGADPCYTWTGLGRRRPQRHQHSLNGQRRSEDGGRLPPTAGRALRQP
jgi:hypothetical protein